MKNIFLLIVAIITSFIFIIKPKAIVSNFSSYNFTDYACLQGNTKKECTVSNVNYGNYQFKQFSMYLPIENNTYVVSPTTVRFSDIKQIFTDYSSAYSYTIQAMTYNTTIVTASIGGYSCDVKQVNQPNYDTSSTSVYTYGYILTCPTIDSNTNYVYIQLSPLVTHANENLYLWLGKFRSISKSENVTTVIQQQTDEIVNATNDLNKTQQKTNNKIDDLNNTLNDDNVDTDSSNSFFNDFDTKDHGGLSSIVTSPLKVYAKITAKCTPINMTVLDKPITLPCGDTLFWNKSEVSSFRIIWNILLGGPILYALLVKLFKTIEALKNPDDDRIEVAKL